VYEDSEIVIKQVKNTIQCVSSHLKQYQSLIQTLTSYFLHLISPILRLQNASVDLLANVVSKLVPSEDYSLDRFSIEMFFRPSIPDNITNWRVFNDYEDIVSFLTSEGSYTDQVIYEDEHDKQMKQSIKENSLPKVIVKLQDLYDLKDRFEKVTNCKLQSSTLRFELINPGSDLKPQNIILGLGLSSNERLAFIHLLKKYKNVFTWNYDDLKTYNFFIIQRTIRMVHNVKPVQQKLRKIHPNLKSQIKRELNKLLKAKIIFPVSGFQIW